MQLKEVDNWPRLTVQQLFDDARRRDGDQADIVRLTAPNGRQVVIAVLSGRTAREASEVLSQFQ